MGWIVPRFTKTNGQSMLVPLRVNPVLRKCVKVGNAPFFEAGPVPLAPDIRGAEMGWQEGEETFMARGYIVPIGGAEEKISHPRILKKFFEICGGPRSRIAIIPTASQLPETGPGYVDIFEELGAAEAYVVSLETRGDCESQENIERLNRADGIFLTGGNQLRLSTTLGGTAIATAIRRLNQAGVHVAGTSAGASFVCAHMIAFGKKGPTPRRGKVSLAPGLGLTNSVIIDQHFRQRDRIGRLLTALAYNPFACGIGLDEDTAAFLDAENNLRVEGTGGLTIVDPSDLDFSSMDQVEQNQPVCLINVRLHILVAGASFNIKTRVATPPEAE